MSSLFSEVNPLCIAPQLFKFIKQTRFRKEKMNYYLDEIQKNPIPALQSLNVVQTPITFALQAQLLCKGTVMDA